VADDPDTEPGELAGVRHPPRATPLDHVTHAALALVIVAVACSGGFGAGYLFSFLIHR